jgi:Tol biopolymer transport system component
MKRPRKLWIGVTTSVGCGWIAVLLLSCAGSGPPGADELATPLQLTSDPADDRRPAWSPDGRRIAFESNRDGNFDIYLVGADGDGLVRLTDHPAQDRRPSWTPDGTRIVFQSDREGSVDLWRLQLETLAASRITDYPGDEEVPAVSPDGRRLAFMSSREGHLQLFVQPLNGGDSSRVTDSDANDIWPTWSPDGTRLGFFSQRAGADDLYLIGADGSDERQLTDHVANDFVPAWDGGDWIAFASMRQGTAAWIFRVHVDSGTVQTLADATGHCTEPAVSPDGSHVALACRPEGERQGRFYDLFVVAAVWLEVES